MLVHLSVFEDTPIPGAEETNDGCIAVRNIMARAFAGRTTVILDGDYRITKEGIRSNMPVWKSRQLQHLTITKEASSPVSPNRDTEIQLCFGTA
jgi:hypothetical protein